MIIIKTMSSIKLQDHQQSPMTKTNNTYREGKRRIKELYCRVNHLSCTVFDIIMIIFMYLVFSLVNNVIDKQKENSLKFHWSCAEYISPDPLVLSNILMFSVYHHWLYSSCPPDCTVTMVTHSDSCCNLTGDDCMTSDW